MDVSEHVCVCVCVCAYMVGCLRNSPGNNSPDRAGGVRGAAAQLDRQHLKAT